MDQQEALRWMHRNIAAFGGDPGNVTVGGQLAGATSTAAVMISPASAGDTAWTTGKFNRMPIMNGSVRDEGAFTTSINELFSGPLPADQ